MPSAPPESLEDFLHVAWDPEPSEARAAIARRRFVSAATGLVITLLFWGGYYAWARNAGDSWQGTGQWTVTAVVFGMYVALVVERLVVWRVAVRRRRRVGEGEIVTASWPGLQIAGHYWDWDSLAAASVAVDAGVAVAVAESAPALDRGDAQAAVPEASAAEGQEPGLTDVPVPNPAVEEPPAEAEPEVLPQRPAVVQTLRGTWGRGDRYLFTTPDGPWECAVEDLAAAPAALAQALYLYSRGRCLVDLSGISH